MNICSCVLFDFDGVLADTEALHRAAFNGAFAARAAEIGGTLEIDNATYLARYHFYSDAEAMRLMLADAGRPHDGDLLARLCATKAGILEGTLGEIAQPLPGVRETLQLLADWGVPCAVCSAARRAEIEAVLRALDLLPYFPAIVSIEDVSRCKPDPEGYLLAFARLQELHGGRLERQSSLVIEDSTGGAQAGRAAGFRVLGVATNQPLEVMEGCADIAAENLAVVTATRWRGWLELD